MNANITFTYDQIKHFNSKINFVNFNSIDVTATRSYDGELTESVQYTLNGGNITIFCDELIFSNGNARLLASTSVTTPINQTYVQVTKAFGSYTFSSMPLRASKGYVLVTGASLIDESFICANMSFYLEFQSLELTLNGPLNFNNATYGISYLNGNQIITGSSLSFENGHVEATVWKYFNLNFK